jgi:hypothetical protein
MEIDIRWQFPRKPKTSTTPWYRDTHNYVVLAITIALVVAVFLTA